jgi:hypothetical protein
LRVLVEVGGNLRQLLAERGVDPAEVVMLRVVDEAAAELAAMPEGAGGRDEAAAAERERRDAERADWREADAVFDKLVRLALLHYADGRRPEPARSSLMEWLAWCMVTPQSPHHPNILLDPEVVEYQRMLRLGSGDPRWR